MDLDMYRHPATRQNLHILQSYGVRVIEPAAGELASGLVGKGRMAEPEEIVASIHRYFERQGDLLGKKVLLTAGPTYEKIDPVRFIGNYSSGKMGVLPWLRSSLPGELKWFWSPDLFPGKPNIRRFGR